MRWWKAVAVAAAMVCLLYGSVAVFFAFDRVSHSASDTLRPFLITVVPVWLVAVAGSWLLLRSPRPRGA